MNTVLASAGPAALLANAPWHCLAGAHRRHALARGDAIRYAPGLVPIAAFRDPARPDLDALAALAGPGECLHLPGAALRRHGAWEHLGSRDYLQMAMAEPAQADIRSTGWRWLGPADAHAVHALAVRCAPGPFLPGMLRLGAFAGIEDEAGALVAAAGTRLVAGRHREICTVCTHPGHRGRGHASTLVRLLTGYLLRHGEKPFLHVEHGQAAAARLYARLGFRAVQVTPLHTLRRAGHAR